MRYRVRRLLASLFVAGAVAGLAPAAMAACRVTDFTDKPLSALNEVQRLSFTGQMLRTEYERLRAAKPGDPNHYALIANSTSHAAAKQAAIARLQATMIENIDDYRAIWASDFLTDEGQRKFTDCVTSRQPGLAVAARSEAPGLVHMSFSHLTPIGIEKIAIKLVATRNVANADEFEAFLGNMGFKDNFSAVTFPVRLIDPSKRAVIVMRAGWETPKFVYIPVYPTGDIVK